MHSIRYNFKWTSNPNLLFAMLSWLILSVFFVQYVSAQADTTDLPAFKSLTSRNTTTFAISEDGLKCVSVHRKDDLLVVWDIASRTQLDVLTCPDPVSVIWRGNKLIVASDKDQSLYIHSSDSKGKWEQTKKFKLPKSQPIHLSAAQHAAFTGEVLVTCGDTKSQREGLLIDVVNDKVIAETEPDYADAVLISGSGRIITAFTSGPTQIGSVKRPMTRQDFPKRGLNQQRVEFLRTNYPYQVGLNPIWFSEGKVFLGYTPSDKGDLPVNGVAIGSFHEQHFYVIRAGEIEIRNCNANISLIGKFKYATHQGIEEALKSKRVSEYPVRRQYLTTTFNKDRLTFHPPVATTINGKLHILVLAPKDADTDDSRLFLLEIDRSKVLKNTSDTKLIQLNSDSPVDSITLSPDRKTLIAAHSTDGRVTFWDISSGTKTTEITGVGRPSTTLLCGNRLFVGELDSTEILEYTLKDGWELVNSYKADIENGVSLIAPQGEDFDNRILVGGFRHGWKLLNPGRGASEEVKYGPRARYSFQGGMNLSGDGKSVIMYGESSGWTFNWDDLIKQPRRPIVQTERTNIAHPTKPKHSPVWIDGNNFYDAQNFALIPQEESNKGLVVIGDEARALAYRIYPDHTVRQIRLIPPFKPGNQVSASLPPFVAEYIEIASKNQVGNLWATSTRTSLLINQPGPGQIERFSFSDDEHLYLVFREPVHGNVYLSVLPRPTGEILASANKDGMQEDTQHHASPSKDIKPEYKVLPIEHPVTTMLVTDDGRHALIALQEQNQILLWDLKENKRVKVLKTKSPRHMLMRGNQLFVANYGEGTISVFDPKRSWQMVDQLGAGSKHPFYLSAPGDDAYDGHLLVTSGTRGTRAVYWVNVNKDEAKFVSQSKQDGLRFGLATINHSGNHVIVQGDSRSADVSKVQGVYLAEDYLQGKREPLSVKYASSIPFLTPTQESGLWIGGNNVWGGNPFEKKLTGGTVLDAIRCIPITGKKEFIVMKSTGIDLHTLKGNFKILDSHKLSAPDFFKDRHYLGFRVSKDDVPVIQEPIAVVADDRLTFLITEPRSGTLIRCDLPLVRTTVANAPNESLKTLPEIAAVGERLIVQLQSDVPDSVYEMMRGPGGATLTEDGRFEWTPTDEDLGRHDIKIRIALGGPDGDYQFLRHEISVLSKSVIAAAESGNAENIGKLFLRNKNPHLTYTHDVNGVLVLDGTDARFLDANGLVVKKTLKLNSTYSQLFDRGSYLVAVHRDGLHILDRNTGKIVRKIDVPCEKIFEAAIRPNSKETYIAILDDSIEATDRIDSKRVLRVNEDTGTVTKLDRIYGQFLDVDPSGTVLYVGLQDTYRSGVVIDLDWGNVYPSYGSVDILASYELHKDKLRFLSIQLTAGDKGKGLVSSPDGQYVCYVSDGGYPKPHPEGKLPIFKSGRVEELVRKLETHGKPIDISFHPTLGLSAVATESRLRIYDKEGESVTGIVDLAKAGLGKIYGIYFPPGGRRIMVWHQPAGDALVCESLPLELNEEQLAIVTKGYTPPKSLDVGIQALAELPAKVADAKQLEGLAATGTGKIMDSKAIGREFSDGVVIVNSATGSGTGFCVGSGGYILTCAHVLSKIGDPTIQYQIKEDGKPVLKKVKATIIRVDLEQDLALLKIDAKLPVLTLETVNKIESGEKTTVIGHPGLGAEQLNYTMTTGIVSNPSQKLDGQTYIQTSAAVNPGNSGGPVINERGRVIGLVVLKGNIESAGFAVPSSRLADFLKKCTTEPEDKE